MNALSRTRLLAEEMTGWRRHFHACPEIAFQETRTSALVAERLRSFGVDEVHEGIARTGVVGVIRGALGDGPGIGLRADMDALPIQEENTFSHASQNPGVMHACGHDGHTTMLLGAAKTLAAERSFRGTVYVIFQPAEENEGGGDVMVKEGLFERFPMTEIYGMHNWPGIAEGVFAIRPGPLMASFDAIELSIEGRGGHAGMPNLTRDSMVAAAHLVVALQTVVSRSLDPIQPAVLSITQIHGGDTWNILPQTAVVRGTVRAFDPQVQDQVEQRIKEIAEGVGRSFDVTISARYIRGYPSTINAVEPTEKAIRAARGVADGRVDTTVSPSMGSEDFAFMLARMPGAYIWLGAGTEGARLHHPRYDFNDAVLPIGAAYWVQLVSDLLGRKGT